MHPDDDHDDTRPADQQAIYPISNAQEVDLHNRFTYHAPLGNQAERYTDLRDRARMLAFHILELTPASREQSLALTKLEEAVFWANAAIARHEYNEVPA